MAIVPVAATGTVLAGSAKEASAPPLPSEQGVAGYLSFGPDEAAFVEAMVNVMCPADHLTPSGVDCGLAVYIDRQLAGGFGKGERLYMRGPWRRGKPQLGYQLPLKPEQFFKVGVAAAQEACTKRFGKLFDLLAPAEADRVFARARGRQAASIRGFRWRAGSTSSCIPSSSKPASPIRSTAAIGTRSSGR